MYTKNYIDLIIMRGKPTHRNFGLLGTLVHEFHIKDVQKRIYYKHHLIPIMPPGIILQEVPYIWSKKYLTFRYNRTRFTYFA